MFPNYPKQNANQSTGTSGNSGQSGSQYEYKFNWPVNRKTGLISLEVTKDDDASLVPVTTVTKERLWQYVWVYDDETQKIKQVKVKLSNADKQQEISRT